VEKQFMSEDDTVTAPLQLLTLASAGSLVPMEEASTRFEPLLSSSRHSALTPSSRFTRLEDPETLLQGFRADEQIHHFAARLQGFRADEQIHLFAARLQGPASAAFPEGLEGREPELTEAANINVVLVADTDLLTDRMWVQVQDFFGQRIPQPWADNGGFLINA